MSKKIDARYLQMLVESRHDYKHSLDFLKTKKKNISPDLTSVEIARNQYINECIQENIKKCKHMVKYLDKEIDSNLELLEISEDGIK